MCRSFQVVEELLEFFSAHAFVAHECRHDIHVGIVEIALHEVAESVASVVFLANDGCVDIASSAHHMCKESFALEALKHGCNGVDMWLGVVEVHDVLRGAWAVVPNPFHHFFFAGGEFLFVCHSGYWFLLMNDVAGFNYVYSLMLQR